MGAEQIGEEPIVRSGPDEHGRDGGPIDGAFTAQSAQASGNGVVVGRDLVVAIAGEEVGEALASRGVSREALRSPST